MINVALFGNPNVGKTTVFNLLTGSNQYVGNWPGVTIEKKEGYLKEDIKIVDLPGIYAMDTFSNEEKVSKSFLENEDVDAVVLANLNTKIVRIKTNKKNNNFTNEILKLKCHTNSNGGTLKISDKTYDKIHCLVFDEILNTLRGGAINGCQM